MAAKRSFFSFLGKRRRRRGGDLDALLGANAEATAQLFPAEAVEPATGHEGGAEIIQAPIASIGQGLRSVRISRALSLEEIAEATRIRPVHLTALEEMDMTKLPSRPFVIGYVRAYARALGLDEDLAVNKFKLDVPAEDGALPEPIGVDDDGDPRRGLFLMAGAAVLAAILIWNVAQRAFNREGPAGAEPAIIANVAPPQQIGAVALGHPLPPPTEATLPKPYVTPGLETFAPEVAAAAALRAQQQLAANPVVSRPFAARGEIKGVPATEPFVLLRAAREVTIIVRRATGPIQDILTLKEGEGYRAPLQPGVVVDASMPSSVEYYIDGMLAGTLTQAVTPVSQLTQPPKPPAP